MIQHPSAVATSQRPYVTTSAPTVDRNIPNRGNQGSAYNPGRGSQERPSATPSPAQPQTKPRAIVPGAEPYKPAAKPAVETPSRPQTVPRPAPNQPSYPLRTAPKTPENSRPASPGQNSGTYYPKGYSQRGGEGRPSGAQPNARPAEHSSDNGRDNGNRGQGHKNDP